MREESTRVRVTAALLRASVTARNLNVETLRPLLHARTQHAEVPSHLVRRHNARGALAFDSDSVDDAIFTLDGSDQRRVFEEAAALVLVLR